MAPGVAHAPPVTDEQSDVHFVPVDCDPSTHKLAELLYLNGEWCPGEDSNFHGLMATGT